MAKGIKVRIKSALKWTLKPSRLFALNAGGENLEEM
jgi:hypothetical protein